MNKITRILKKNELYLIYLLKTVFFSGTYENKESINEPQQGTSFKVSRIWEQREYSQHHA